MYTSRGHGATFFSKADAYYENILAAINGATESVVIESYIFNFDRVGQRFVEALSAAAQRGCRVRVLVDGFGSIRDASRLAEVLKAAGVEFKIYHPMPWRLATHAHSWQKGYWLYKILYFIFNINRRNHRKLYLVDSTLAWTGSFNISASHLGDNSEGKPWRDYGVCLRDDTVVSLSQGFDNLWLAGPARFYRGFFSRYLSNRSLASRRLKNRFLLRRIDGRENRLWISSAYFSPTAAIRRGILRACERGVDVRLILPDQSDVPVFPALSGYYYRELLDAGAKIYRFNRGVLHAKALLLDDLAIVGSSNLNYRSLLHDLELDVVIYDPGVVDQLQDHLRGDMDNSSELDLQTLMPVGLAAHFYYGLRYWM